MVAIPKNDGGLCITINYKKLKSFSSLGQLATPRVNEVLGSLGKGCIFFPFDLVSSFHQTAINKDTISFTAFCISDRLFEGLVLPQDRSAAPGWFVKVIKKEQKIFERVAAYLDVIIVYDPGPTAHTSNNRIPFKHLRKHNLELSPANAKLGFTAADFLFNAISSAGVSVNDDKATPLTKITMPTNVKQARLPIGITGYCCKFLGNLVYTLTP